MSTTPNKTQQYFLDRLQANVDKAQAEADRIIRVLQPHIDALVAQGGDPNAPRMADFEDSDDNYAQPSYNQAIKNAQNTVTRRQKDYDDYRAKIGLEDES
jgi:hypothetical protein